jgi:MYXO-CTERM domain-containing protein
MSLEAMDRGVVAWARCGVMGGLLLAAPTGVAWAQEVTFEGAAQNAGQSGTLRVPATGSFAMPAVTGGYMTVSVAVSDLNREVALVTWAGSGSMQSMTRLSKRIDSSAKPGSCRAELWGLANPQPGLGSVTVTLIASAAPSAVAGGLMAFSQVGATSTDGPCCAAVSNDGSGTSVISKTLVGTSRGDMLVDAVCSVWQGSDPGPAVPDLAENAGLVARMSEAVRASRFYGFAATSPGADRARPAIGSQSMRWLQGGSHDWSLTAVILQPLLPAIPPDAGALPTRDARAPSADTLSLVGDTSSPDSAPALEADAAVTPRDAGAEAPGPGPPDSAVQAVGPDAEGGGASLAEDGPVTAPHETTREVQLSVGCACGVGQGAPGGGVLLVLAALALARVRARRARERS